MAGTTLGFLKFVLGFDSIAFKKGMTEAERDLVKLQKKIEKFGAGMSKIGKSMSLAVTAPLAAFAVIGVKEARETAEAMGQVEASLASMGGVSGKTADELAKLADKMELHSLYEADEILRSVTTNLLTFGNISGETFNRTQQVVVDLATKMKTDLQSATLLVGKALNDPIKGMAGLGRAGIQLSEAQKVTIKSFVKTGDVAKAQLIILAELERQFGGSAQAAQNTDPYNALSDAFKNLAEQLGTALLPYLKATADNLTSLISGFANMNGPLKDVVVTLGLMVALTGPVLYLLGNIIKIAAGFKVLALFAAGLTSISVAEGAAATGAYALGASLSAFLGPIALATAAFWALYEAFRAFPSLKTAVVSTITTIADYIGGPLIKAISAAHPLLMGLIAAMGILAKGGGAKGKVSRSSLLGDLAGSASDLGAQMLAATDFSAKPIVPDLLPVGGGGKKAKAKAKGVDAAKQLADRVGAINDRLFPDEAALKAYQKDLADLVALYGNAADNADKLARSTSALNSEFEKSLGDPAILQDVTSPLDEFDLQASNDKIERETDKTLTKVADLNKSKTAEMLTAWGDFATGAVDAMRGMVEAFKSGDILGGIQGILDIVLKLVQTLASLGTFGTTGASGAGGAGGSGLAFGGMRAGGGPVVPGKVYGVGENGPEWFSPKKRGYIHPTGDGAPQRVVVVPSPYFDVVVDKRAANVAAPMAGRAAIIGVTGSEVRAQRRGRRNLLAA